MAQILLDLKLVLPAAARAYDEMKPQSNHLASAWSRNEQTLADIRLAALWAEQHGYAVEQVVLSVQEAQLLEPYIKP